MTAVAPEEPLGAADRRERIIAVLAARGFASVTDLSVEFAVSAVTVRGDLAALEAGGDVRRVRGGAMPAGASTLRELSFEQAQIEAAEEKRQIANAVVDRLEPGMSVLLDVGTTTAAVARELRRREDLGELTVITNGLSIALALEPAVPRIQVVVMGGSLRPLQHSLVAPLADTVLERVRADVAIIGCNGADASAGVTNINLPEAAIKRRMIAAATHTVVVADGSKMGRVHLGRVAAMSEVDLVVTGSSAPTAVLTELDASGTSVVVAPG